MPRRPEEEGPPELYYSGENAELYASNARMQDVQEQLTDRALELLELPESAILLLDIGCGTGISTHYLNECGYLTCGVDVSMEMLSRNETDNLCLLDIGDGLPFQPGSFDGAVSISALQWLCYSNSRNEDPFQRLLRFFDGLFGALKPGARAVLQFYPDSEQQLQLVQDAARRAGFGGRLQVDFPNSSKARKIYLVLQCGLTAAVGCGSLPTERSAQRRRESRRPRRPTRVIKGSREWILRKRAARASRGEEVRAPTRYTGRRRHGVWK